MISTCILCVVAAGDLTIPTFTDATATRLSADAAVGADDISEKDYGLGDFDNDGDIDVLSARRIALKINIGQPLPNTLFMNEAGVLTDRTSTLAPALLVPLRSRDVVVDDFNNDGWLDAIVVHGPLTRPTLLVNLGETDGIWRGLREVPGLLPTGFQVDGWNISSGDITSNGFPDAFIGTRNGADRFMANLGLDGGRNWLGFADESSRLGANANTTAVRSSAIVDINNDGDMDLIEGQTCCDGIVRLLSNDGSGNLDGPPQTIFSGQAYNFALGDLNGDGNLDILGVKNATDQVRINNGASGDAISWGALLNVPASAGFGSIVRVGDLNNDGTDDFLVCDRDQEFPEDCSRRLNIYFNSGVSPFLNDGYSSPVAWTPNGTSDVALLDLDDDGDLDMLIGACNSQIIFMQDGSPTPAPCDINGDGVMDVDDLIAVILAWATNDPAADIDGSGLVDVDDLVLVILLWGPCN